MAGGSYSFFAKVTDADGAAYVKSLSITVNYSDIRVTGGSLRYYSLLQDASNSLADGETLSLHGVDFYEDLNFDRDITMILRGGYDVNFGSSGGLTKIHGSITISKGTVVIENLVLMP